MLGKLPAEAFSGDSVWIPFRVSVRVARSKVRTAKRLAHAGSKLWCAIAGEPSASYAPQLGLLVSQPSRPWIVLGIEGGGDRDRKSHLFTPCLDLVVQHLGHTSRARSSPHASEVYPFVLSEGASLTLVFEELEAVSTRSLRALARRQRATGW